MNAPALGWWTWAAMVAVLAAAAVLSFAALRDLAELCGVEPALAWLLPVCVDAGAAVSTRVWLDGRAVAAERYARRMTFAMLAVTVAGNALHSGLVASGLTPTWWTAVLVGGIPPAVVGSTVHLAVLVGRPVTPRVVTTPAPAAGLNPVQVGEVAAGDNLDGVDRAAELIAEGAGRRRLARELDVTEHQARELLAVHRNGGGPRG